MASHLRKNLRQISEMLSTLVNKICKREIPELAGARALSLTARLGLALCCFERYCRVVGLHSPSIQSFLDYMWEWPLRMTPAELTEWESRRTDLVETGLGDPVPDDVRAVLQKRGIDESEFQSLVESTVEIIFGSFYGAAEDERSLAYLTQVVSICARRGIRPPPLSVFAASRFEDRDGWGHDLSIQEGDRWRAEALKV